MKQNGRDAIVDAARGIGMVLVLYGHALEPFFIGRTDGKFAEWAFIPYKMIYSFHMPLFFLLSGAVQPLLKDKNVREAAFRSLNLLVIALLSHEAGLIAVFFDRAEPLSHWYLLKWSVRPLVEGFDFSLPVLWFVVALAVVQGLFWAAVAVRSAYVYVPIALLAGASLVFSLRPELPDVFQIKIWTPAFVFFGGGWALGRLSIAVPKGGAILGAVGVLVLFGLNQGCAFSVSASCPVAHLSGHFAVHMIQGDVGNLSLFYVTALLGSIGVLGLAALMPVRPLLWIGRNSLEIFIANGFVLAFVNPLLAALPLPEGLPAVLAGLGLSLGANIAAIVVLRWPIRLMTRAARTIARAITRSLPEAGLRAAPIGKT